MKKIFIGFVNIASMITDYKMGFETLGLGTITAVYQSSPIQHTVVDYDFSKLIAKMDVAVSRGSDHKGRDEFAKELKGQIWERALRECDIFIFIWSSFMPDFSDYIELKRRGKKIVTFFVGNDIRWIPAMEQEFAKYNLPKKDYGTYYRMIPLVNKLIFLRTAEKYSDLIVSHPGMSQLALRPYFNLGMPLWLDKFRNNICQRRIPKIIHAPSNRGIKGTKYVLDVFSTLKNEGLKFATELIENLPNLEAIKKYGDADILVGQLFSTYGGRQELEALACGSIVLSGFRPDYALDYINKNSQYYKKISEYPVVSVDPDSLYHELKNIILDYPRRIEIAKKGRPFVEKYHDVKELARRTLELLEQDNTEPDCYPKFFRNEFIPESHEVAVCNKYSEMVKQCNWYKKHVMPGERCGLIFPEPNRAVSSSKPTRKAGASTKLLYLAFVNTNYEQILAKIAQQFKAIKAICDNSECYVVGVNNRNIPLEKYSNINYIELKKTAGHHSLKEYYSVSEEIAQSGNYDIIYFRYPFFNHLTYEFVSKFDNVVFENQSIVENEISLQEAEIEKKFAPFILAKARGIVGVTNEILKYELSRSLKKIPGHVMSNGIDTDSIDIMTPHYHPNELHLFCASHFSPWHGIDRLIKGLAQSKDFSFITLHLAGEGPEIPRLKEMVQQYRLKERVIFHGYLSKEQIDKIAKFCQIGVGALGVHRKGLKQSVALKNREYCLRGIPFVYAGEDVDFHPGLPFVRIFPANDEPINIQVLVDFAEEIARHPEIREQERQYSTDNLGWDKKIIQLIQFLDGLVNLKLSKTPVFEIPKSLEHYTERIQNALYDGDIKGALQICEEALTEYKQQPSLWFGYGTILRLSERNEEAVTALERSLNLFETPEALFELFHVLHLLGRDKDKERVKEKLVKQYPSWKEKLKKIDPAQSRGTAFVSVIIPCYNQAQYLPDAVASVVNQTYRNWECIIVNDGSPDSTTIVAKELISKYSDKRIRLVEKTNGGLADARNAGIKVSQGKYWVPLDSDDMIAPTFLEKTVQILDNKPEVGFVYSHIQHFGMANNLFPLPDFDAHTVVHIDNICCVCSLVRRSVWEEVGGYNVSMREGYEDWDFWVGCIEKGWKGYRIPEALFMYRKTGSSMLGSANEKREELIARIVLNHPSQYDEDRIRQAKSVLGLEKELNTPDEKRMPLRITYLISSILGVTGGNITLLNQVNALSERGHNVTIVTYTDKPQWIDINARIIRVPQAEPMAPYVPASHAVVSTYFSNTAELVNIDAPVKIYYAQGDQYVFEDDTPSPNPRIEQQRRRMRKLSKASYLCPNVHFVPNSRNLAGAVERAYGKKPEAILPVCTDQRIFRPLQKPVVGSKWRILIVGPDRRGSDLEPLFFKGIDDIRRALEKLSKRFNHFTAIRLSNTEPDIFKDFPCEFYICPSDELKTFLYGTAHILVYASHYDSCPRPPQEAMAAGTAVVCTATPGAMEYCRDNENCLLVPIKSPGAIAEAVERLIKDGSLRERLIKGGFATARGFPCEREWDELEDLLYRLMEESGIKYEEIEILPDEYDFDLYQNIRSLIDAGRSGEAIKALKELLISNPDCALAHNDLGVLYIEEGEKEKAVYHYEQAVRLEPENITFLKNLADLYCVAMGRIEDALRIYVKVLAIQPRDTETLLTTGHICVALQRFDDAKTFYDRVLQIDPGNMDAGQSLDKIVSGRLDKGDIDADEENYDKSQKNDEQCIVSDKKDILASIIISASGNQKYIKRCVESIRKYTSEPFEIIFVDNGSKKGILSWLKKAVKENANYKLVEMEKNACPSKYYNEGIRASTGEYVVLLHDDAVVSDGWFTGMLRCFNNAPDTGIIGPMTNNTEGIQKDAGVDYRSIDHFDRYARKFLEKNMYRQVPVTNVSGFCLMFKRELIKGIGEFDEQFNSEEFMLRDFCRSAELDGYRNIIASDVFVHHDNRQKMNGDKRHVPAILSRDRKIFSEKWNYMRSQNSNRNKLISLELMKAADEFSQKGQASRAVDNLLKGIGISPNDERLYYALSKILIDAKHFKDALDVLNEMPPCGDDVRKLELTGYCMEGMGRYDEADEYADRALSLNPLSASALNLKGILAYMQGDIHASEAFFERAIELDPAYGVPYKNLGSLKSNLKQGEALNLFEKSFILSPDVIDTVTDYHAAISAVEEYERGEKVFREASSLYPNNKMIKYKLIDTLIKQEKYDAAMKEIEEAITLFALENGFLSAALQVRKILGPEGINREVGKKGTVSLCMIVKNEEEQLAKCLGSVKPIVDEIIVVDTGSNDRTKDIARVFGAKVYDFEWTNDFSEARNFSILKASGEWIFVMDADEVISPLDYENFIRLVRKSTAKPAAYAFMTRNYTTDVNQVKWIANDGKYPKEDAGSGWTPSHKVRLFPNDGCIQFEFPVHELVENSLKRSDIRIKNCNIPVHHYGKLNQEKSTSKGEEYYRIGRKKLDETGDDLAALRELAVQAQALGKFDESIELWGRFIAMQPNTPLAFVNIGAAYCKLGKYEDALKTAKRALELAPDTREALYNYSLSKLHLGRAEQAIPVLEKLLERNPEYPPAQFILAASYCCNGNKKKGVQCLEQLRKTALGPSLSYRCLDLAKGLVEAQCLEYALSVLEGSIESKNSNNEVLAFYSECLKIRQCAA
jgi:glycosyltransferase involved in cell wall biosynthesis